MGDDANTVTNTETKIKTQKFKDIDYNILLGAAERYNELKFNVIKSKYPNVESLKEFLTSEKYLGNSVIEITYVNEINGIDLRNACIQAFNKIANYVISIKQEYEGSRQFEPIQLKTVLKDKSIYLSKIDENGGKGDSQNNCKNPDYKLDLANEKWYVFNDNYGTNEEKLFIKYFKTDIEPKLKEKGLEYYVIRNERIPELAIYSFEQGERFEPDFLIFVVKKDKNKIITNQLYVEPKGKNLLEEDEWKEKFMQEMEKKAFSNEMLNYENEYKIIGLPFYNEEYRRKEFGDAIEKWLKTL